jgi:hypothetical protein
MELKKASRKKVKIRLGLSGASGFGKTYSALLVAKGLCGDWSKIAVIDTENSSASLYSHLGDFNTLELTPPYAPERYIEAINACVKAGMEVIIIDSITHEWDGKGGCLEIVESLGGRYQDWSKVTPRHQSFINAITQSPVHIITTVRRKQDFDIVKNDKGKIEVQKVGTKEVTREGFEYELTLSFELLNDKHVAKASKDRTRLFMGKPEFVVTEATGELIKKWCEEGEAEKEEPAMESVDISDKLQLFVLLNSSTLEPETDRYKKAWNAIETCPNYKEYEKIRGTLEDLQPSIDQIPNPSQKDINNHVKKIA